MARGKNQFLILNFAILYGAKAKGRTLIFELLVVLAIPFPIF
jgi:hypothetical protein